MAQASVRQTVKDFIKEEKCEATRTLKGFKPKDLRSAFANTFKFSETEELKNIANVLGHSSDKVASFYIRATLIPRKEHDEFDARAEKQAREWINKDLNGKKSKPKKKEKKPVHVPEEPQLLKKRGRPKGTTKEAMQARR